MGQKQELKDQIPESSVEHEINHHPHRKQAKCLLQIHTTGNNLKQTHQTQKEGSNRGPPQGPSQEAFIDERRESTHISLIHKFSHPAPNMREP
jgi:hypothetical protein